MTPSDAIALLRSNPLRNIASLKMLTLYGQHMQLRFTEDASGWALVSMLPTRVSAYHARAYPDAHFAAFVNGTSSALTLQLLGGLPQQRYVLKTSDAAIKQHVLRSVGARPVAAFASFTAPRGWIRHGADTVGQSSILLPEVARLLGQAGYPESTLQRTWTTALAGSGFTRVSA